MSNNKITPKSYQIDHLPLGMTVEQVIEGIRDGSIAINQGSDEHGIPTFREVQYTENGSITDIFQFVINPYGLPYALKPGVMLPYTIKGDWSEDEDNFRAIGNMDDISRSVMYKFQGLLTGDDVEDFEWFAGDTHDEDVYLGDRTFLSSINEKSRREIGRLREEIRKK